MFLYNHLSFSFSKMVLSCFLFAAFDLQWPLFHSLPFMVSRILARQVSRPLWLFLTWGSSFHLCSAFLTHKGQDSSKSFSSLVPVPSHLSLWLQTTILCPHIHTPTSPSKQSHLPFWSPCKAHPCARQHLPTRRHCVTPASAVLEFLVWPDGTIILPKLETTKSSKLALE